MMAHERLTPLALGISDSRNAELSFISGLIQMEIKKEYGPCISRVHIVRAALASPYLMDEVERAWVIATLCEMLPGPEYGLTLGAFQVMWNLWEDEQPDWSMERRMAEYKDIALGLRRGRSP